MPQRLDSSCSCAVDPYSEFDRISAMELTLALTADAIVNKSTFCTHFSLSELDQIAHEPGLTLKDHVYGLKGKMGLYHVWIEEDMCYDHDLYSMLALYVGKGEAMGRIQDHADARLPKAALISVSFFECENRVAKYLEQLFLDTYRFILNKNENCGTAPLYASWGGERRLLGTELYNISNRPNAPTGE